MSDSPEANKATLVEIIERAVESVEPSKLALFMVLLSHQLTIAVRGYYDGYEAISNPAKIIALNEIQHRLTTYSADILLGQDYVTTSTVSETLMSAALQGRCLWDVFYALSNILSEVERPDERYSPTLDAFMEEINEARTQASSGENKKA